jgi:hypothetical protein
MLLFFAFVSLLGVAVAVLPVLATASEVKLEVNENCVEPAWPCWATPGSSQPASKVTIASGGLVMFVDHGKEANIAWTGTAPACESSVPVAPAAPKTGWEGKCTFATPGTYKFESSTLFKDAYEDYTKYEVVVEGTPKAKTTSTSTEHQTEATLTGSIEPEGNPTEYHFEYGSGSVSEHSSASTSLGASDFTSHSVSLPVSDLSPGTEYHFELIVSYGASQTVSGGPQTFTTPPATKPTASTLAASALQKTEATLNGKVDPEGGAEAEYFFEWGAGSGGSYEHTTNAVSLPSDGAEHQASAIVMGLTPGSEYHFRLVAKNGLGSVQGNDLTFMAAPTAPAKEPTKEPPAKEPSPTPTISSSPPPQEPQVPLVPAETPLSGLSLRAVRHGAAVSGSLEIARTAAGGKLEIELLAKGASLSRRKHASGSVRVGSLMRSAVSGGKLTFSIPLTARAKQALKHNHVLSVTVKVLLTPTAGKAVTITRAIVL